MQDVKSLSVYNSTFSGIEKNASGFSVTIKAFSISNFLLHMRLPIVYMDILNMSSAFNRSQTFQYRLILWACE